MKLGQMKKLALIIPMLLIIVSSTSVSVTASNIKVPTTAKPNAVKLVVATRHDSSIYQKYAKAFAESQYGKSVGITNPNEIEFLAPTTYDAFYRAMTNPKIGASIGWGGGDTVFTKLAMDGALAPITDQGLLDFIKANVSDTIAGANMKYYNSNNSLEWVAAAISSFGFTVNHDVLKERGLKTPQSWDDLASPDFFTTNSEFNIGMGNAPDTTSNTRIYQIILQNYGWEKGWQIIYQMAGNSKIYGGSVETRSSVISGETAVAMTIDFYGVIAMTENPACEYIIPKGASLVNADPIALAKNAPDKAAAIAFTKFVLSAQGQALWMDKTINRLPIRYDAFAEAKKLAATDPGITLDQINTIEALYNKTISNSGIKFNEDLALSLEEAMRYHFESTITQVHSTLREAWASIVNEYKSGTLNGTALNDTLAKYGAPLISQSDAQSINEQIITDPNFRLKTQSSWENQATDKYRQFIKTNASVQNVPFDFMFSISAIFALIPLLKLYRRKNWIKQ